MHPQGLGKGPAIGADSSMPGITQVAVLTEAPHRRKTPEIKLGQIGQVHFAILRVGHARLNETRAAEW